MSNWRLIMNRAEVAKDKMFLDLDEGKTIFQDLFDEFGSDGMIFLERGQAYEHHNLFTEAADDYEMAQSLFPMQSWKETAANHLLRVNKKILSLKNSG